MRIKELYIENFGGLSDLRLSLADGINLITGDNESGKSTVAAFIAYAFYGFADKAAKKLLADMKTGISVGSVTVETDMGEIYIISRKDGETARSSSVEVRTLSGEVFDGWKDSGSPGDYFMGIPYGLFMRSVYVSQRYGAEQAGDSVEAVRNLLISGSEATDLRRALKKLEDVRVELLHKNGKGGKLFNANARITECENEMRKAYEMKTQAETAMSEIRGLEKKISELNDEADAVRDRIEQLRVFGARKILEECETLSRQSEEIKRKRSLLDREYEKNGYLPDRDYSARLEEAENIKRNAASDGELMCARAERLGSLALSHVRGNGGFDSFTAKVSLMLRTSRLCFLSGVASIVLAVGSMISGILLAVMLSFALGIGVSVGAFALAIGGVVLFKKKSALDGEMREITAPLLSLGTMGAERDVLEALAILENNQDDIDENIRLASEAETAHRKATELCDDLLEKWGKASAEQAIGQANRYFGEADKLDGAAESVREKMRLYAVKLSVYPDTVLQRAKESEGADGAVVETEEQLLLMLEKTERACAELTENYNALRLDHAKNYSSLPSPDQLLERRSLLVAERDSYMRRYRAVTLALDTLRSSDSELRRTVTPFLSEKAGKLFGEMTGAKYQGLGVDGESDEIRLTFKTDSGFVSSEYLSAGSADLAWLCLRLAMNSRISRTERLPLVLDECFVCFDDTRLSRMLGLLNGMVSEGTQVFLFSANKREAESLKNADIIFNSIKLG